MISNRVNPKPTPGPVRAISIKQPWAWAILHAGKRIENRTRRDPWYSAIGKTVLLHASAQQTRRDWLDAASYIRATPGGDKLGPMGSLPMGGIVGSCCILDVYACRDGYNPPELADQDRWIFGPWCLLLGEVKVLDFRPCKGHQGLWTVPEELWP
jgi:hypothetical protein